MSPAPVCTRCPHSEPVWFPSSATKPPIFRFGWERTLSVAQEEGEDGSYRSVYRLSARLFSLLPSTLLSKDLVSQIPEPFRNLMIPNHLASTAGLPIPA